MDRSDLEMVNAVRQQGSLALAAQALGLTPSAVTRRLAALEASLGVRLFQRTTRRVSPTAEGETLAQRAAELLRGFEALEVELRERQAEPAGPIRLAATFGFGRRWVGPALARFQARHPAVSIQLQLTERLPDLAAEGLDGAIWLWGAPDQRAGEWVSRRLAPNRRVLVAAPAYLAVHGTPQSPDELAMHHCLVVREHTDALPHRQDHWALQREGESTVRRVAVAGPMTSNSGELVRDWCLAGHGVMLRSLWDVAPLIASGALVHLLPEWSHRDADIHWLAPWQAQSPKRIRLLVAALAEAFRDEPWRPVPAPLSAARARPGSRRTR
ncbi:LysR family transcriptional regulator [Hydrogenophaga crocea]|uniref:LysR family transcriptional regulator n=1 Tax=Hydrogenophaga crocea TaxID=2716225 RepID=A0A6G8IH71_9BURK|nr:LysR family transcriptional regulator [Hydrogenophaga crocea]QIM52395.1 LysR family transcriptional regulator [Hydrogenophaga crocea]